MVKFLVPVIAFAIFGLPTFAAAWLPLTLQNTALRMASVVAAPAVFTVYFLLVSGGVSTLFHRAITKGKFPRDLKHPVYGPRRLYGLCWTSLYYNSPVYYLALTIPVLRKVAFRLFGYKGDLDF